MSEIDLNYAVWPANTEVTLCNVPWNTDYRDIVDFQSRSNLNNYLDRLQSTTISTRNVSYHRPGNPIRLDIPFSLANEFNYMHVRNRAQPVNGDTARDYYYFISQVRHLAPNTTEFVIQLDVWQTYGFDIRFGNCFVEGGHIGVANERRMENQGRDYLTIPEGLDAGGEYVITATYGRRIASAVRDDSEFAVMVISTVALNEDPGDVKNPKQQTATGNSLEHLPNGTEAYIFSNGAEYQDFLRTYQDYPWITQGIISVSVIPKNAETDYGIQTTERQIKGMTIKEIKGGPLNRVRTKLGGDWRKELSTTVFSRRYRHLDKFLTYPYTILELTAHTGTPLVLKPESWGAEIEVVEVPHFAQPGPRIVFYPYRYNAHETSLPWLDTDTGVLNDGGEFLDMATGIFNFPSFATVNNSYLSYMASNANAISYQHSAADWSQQRALAGNSLAAHQATNAIGTSQRNNNLQIDASRQSTNLANEQAVMGGALGALGAGIGGLMKGGAAGAMGSIASTAAGTALSINKNEQSYGISSNLSRSQNANQNDLAGMIRDSNHDYADWAANGDYQSAIAGINAKVQDAKMIQPTTSGQVGGDAFLLAQYQWGYDVKVKTIQPGAMARIGEYWLRYGYQVSRFMQMPESLHCMSLFTYWKLSETYIVASRCPESFKQTIRGIFEKGVTVWRNPDDIGNVDIGDNAPISGIRY